LVPRASSANNNGIKHQGPYSWKDPAIFNVRRKGSARALLFLSHPRSLPWLLALRASAESFSKKMILLNLYLFRKTLLYLEYVVQSNFESMISYCHLPGNLHPVCLHLYASCSISLHSVASPPHSIRAGTIESRRLADTYPELNLELLQVESWLGSGGWRFTVLILHRSEWKRKNHTVLIRPEESESEIRRYDYRTEGRW
jgi:hypothetical protein